MTDLNENEKNQLLRKFRRYNAELLKKFPDVVYGAGFGNAPGEDCVIVKTTRDLTTEEINKIPHFNKMPILIQNSSKPPSVEM